MISIITDERGTVIRNNVNNSNRNDDDDENSEREERIVGGEDSATITPTKTLNLILSISTYITTKPQNLNIITHFQT